MAARVRSLLSLLCNFKPGERYRAIMSLLFQISLSTVDFLYVFLNSHFINKIMLDHLTLFPHTTFLQQTTLNIFCRNIVNLCNWMDNLWLKVENIEAKGEIARFVQFLLLSLCFQKAACCRGVRLWINTYRSP